MLERRALRLYVHSTQLCTYIRAFDTYMIALHFSVSEDSLRLRGHQMPSGRPSLRGTEDACPTGCMTMPYCKFWWPVGFYMGTVTESARACSYYFTTL